MKDVDVSDDLAPGAAARRWAAARLTYGGIAVLALAALVAALFAPGVIVAPVAAVLGGACFAALGAKGHSTDRQHDLARMSIGQILERQVQNGRRISIIDPSTGLLQRWYFDLRVSEEVNRCNRYGLPMTIVRLSVGSERPVHDGAEEWHLARVIARHLRQVDFASRVSATDFVVCLPHTASAGGKIVATRLVRGLREWHVQAGVASYPTDGKDLESLEGAALARQSDDWAEAGRAPLQNAGLQERVARLRPGEVASVSLGPGDSARTVRKRLQRAAKQAGKDLMVWQGPGQMLFRLSTAEAESEVA
jgi:GGDEF domain-containing protein